MSPFFAPTPSSTTAVLVNNAAMNDVSRPRKVLNFIDIVKPSFCLPFIFMYEFYHVCMYVFNIFLAVYVTVILNIFGCVVIMLFLEAVRRIRKYAYFKLYFYIYICMFV